MAPCSHFPSLPACLLALQNPNAPTTQRVTMYDTLKTQSILQLGMLSLVPYLAGRYVWP